MKNFLLGISGAFCSWFVCSVTHFLYLKDRWLKGHAWLWSPSQRLLNQDKSHLGSPVHCTAGGRNTWRRPLRCPGEAGPVVLQGKGVLGCRLVFHAARNTPFPGYAEQKEAPKGREGRRLFQGLAWPGRQVVPVRTEFTSSAGSQTLRKEHSSRCGSLKCFQNTYFIPSPKCLAKFSSRQFHIQKYRTVL